MKKFLAAGALVMTVVVAAAIFVIPAMAHGTAPKANTHASQANTSRPSMFSEELSMAPRGEMAAIISRSRSPARRRAPSTATRSSLSPSPSRMTPTLARPVTTGHSILRSAPSRFGTWGQTSIARLSTIVTRASRRLRARQARATVARSPVRSVAPSQAAPAPPSLANSMSAIRRTGQPPAR